MNRNFNGKIVKFYLSLWPFRLVIVCFGLRLQVYGLGMLLLLLSGLVLLLCT